VGCAWSDQIVLMGNAYPGAGATIGGSSGVPDYYDRLRDVKVMEEQALYQGRNTRETMDRRTLALRGAGFAAALVASCGLATLHFDGAAYPNSAGGVLGSIVGNGLGTSASTASLQHHRRHAWGRPEPGRVTPLAFTAEQKDQQLQPKNTALKPAQAFSRSTTG
jgi:hypothetical protein